MFGFKTNKPRERFYLLPGQGGRNYRQKQRRFLTWTVVVSLVFGSILALILWWTAKPKP